MQPSPIYTVTTVVLPSSRGHRPRCVGWYPTLEQAQNAAARNVGSLHECLYTHIIIEEVTSGIYPLNETVWWYEWDDDSRSWQPCNVPADADGIINYGMG